MRYLIEVDYELLLQKFENIDIMHFLCSVIV